MHWNGKKLLSPRGWWIGGVAAITLLAAAGCSRIHPKPVQKFVYVTAKQAYLHDRVAAVSNRTGEVTNGEKLVVIGRARKWVQVQAPDGAVGWLEESKTADDGVAEGFEALKVAHKADPTVAQATTRDEVLLHIAPGRESKSFFRLPEGEKLELLKRASVEKGVQGGAAPAKSATAPAAPAKAGAATPSAEPPAPVFEDWWLVRDTKGDTGWIYSHLIDVDAPDTLARYAEGQRYVAAYLLAMVDDPDSGMVNNGQPVTQIPEYVTVLSPYKAGLPYDFNQVRVFTWNVKMHRYETAYREHDVAGYLPVVIEKKSDPYSKGADAATELPAFTFRVLAAGETIPTPGDDGILKPGKMVTKTFRLVGGTVRKVSAPGPAAAEFHLEPEVKAAGKKAKK